MGRDSTEELKRIVGRAAAERFVTAGMRLGLGSGSTAIWTVRRVGERWRDGSLAGLRVVTTSLQCELEARSLGLPVVTLNDAGMEEGLDLAIDGADEVDRHGRLIKGGGGAMLMEKVVASASRRFVVVVDESKLSDRLGQRSAVPLEVVPAAFQTVRRALVALGAEVSVRQGVSKVGPVVTDLGNLLVDARFHQPFDPPTLEAEINGIPGVLENGLFTGMRPLVLVARAGGGIEELAF
jgi:ribose 5-phosphate isomerase A